MKARTLHVLPVCSPLLCPPRLWLVGWLVGRLVGRLIGRLVGRLVSGSPGTHGTTASSRLPQLVTSSWVVDAGIHLLNQSWEGGGLGGWTAVVVGLVFLALRGIRSLVHAWCGDVLVVTQRHVRRDFISWSFFFFFCSRVVVVVDCW